MSKKKKIILIVISILIAILAISLVVRSIGDRKSILIELDITEGQIVQEIEISSGTSISILKVPKREDLTFDYWLVNGNKVDSNYEFKDKDKVKAVWKEKQKLCTVSFIVEDKEFKKEEIVCGETVKKPNISNLKLTNKKFKTWLLDGKEYNFNEPVTKDITLVAKLEEEKKEESNNSQNNKPSNNGGTSQNNQNNSSSNNTQNSPSTNKNEENNSKPSTPSTPVVQNYTVTFDSNGGTNVSSVTVKGGTTVSEPGSPSRTGYNFGGWLLNGQPYNFSSPVNSNITLVASWVAKSYRVVSTPVDKFSPDVVLSVYEGGNIQGFSTISYTDGVFLCDSSNPTVSKVDLEGESSLLVTLSDGTQVIATIG